MPRDRGPRFPQLNRLAEYEASFRSHRGRAIPSSPSRWADIDRILQDADEEQEDVDDVDEG